MYYIHMMCPATVCTSGKVILHAMSVTVACSGLSHHVTVKYEILLMSTLQLLTSPADTSDCYPACRGYVLTNFVNGFADCDPVYWQLRM